VIFSDSRRLSARSKFLKLRTYTKLQSKIVDRGTLEDKEDKGERKGSMSTRVGWVEERNPTLRKVCWVTLTLN
jgi:hypothetical protein